MAKITVTIEGQMGDPELRVLLDRLTGEPVVGETRECGCKPGAHYVMTAEESRGIEEAAGELVGITPQPATLTEVPPAAEGIALREAMLGEPTRTEIEHFFNEPEIDPVAALGQPAPAPPVTAAPAPPITPAAPPAPTTPAPPLAGAVVDSEGLPWDKRIHASTKTRRQSDNTWKLLKGIDQALVAQVKAELRAAMGAPVPAAVTPSPAPTGPQPVTPPPGPTEAFRQGAAAPIAALGAPALAPAPAPPSAAMHDGPTPPAGSEPPVSFAGFIQVVTKAQQAGKLTTADVLTACQKYGLASTLLINSRLDLIPAIYRELEAIWLTHA
jgi:hypothetical protein